ncbi:hypothetical protein MNBD_ALPHA12-2291 [hydrothermal vent metagenome]|uniref:Polysaccharide chain length determinant N-terminal domain-containing protein n=1 Tax=hydrothermal vent metagenome TaxID=652676 RepID=A0A3B0TNR3_9ZZZZ
MDNQTSGMAGIDGVQIDMKAIVAKIWRHKYRIIFVTLLLNILVYAFLLFVPKLYQSSASVLVEPRSSVFSRAANDLGNTTGSVADAVLMSSQVELLQSTDLLLRVVRSQKLVDIAEFNGSSKSLLDPVFSLLGRSKAPSNVEQIALANLLNALTVIQQRDSRVISILVRTRDRNLSARLANAIARAHVNRRAELSIDDTADATKWLKTEIAKLRIAVVNAEAAVAKFKIDNNLFSGTNNTSLVDQQLSSIANQITTAQERRDTARSRVTLIRAMINSGQSIDGVADVRDSAVIQRLSEQKGRLEGERAQLLSTLLPNHPQVKALSAQINETNKQIVVEGRRVADALEAEAQIEQTLIASLQDELTRLKSQASTAATSSVRLRALEREAQAQSDLLQTYLLRFRDASARTDAGAALPDVRVITIAMPAMKAVSPKTSLIMIAVTIVSLAVQVGSIFFAELSAPVPLAPFGRTRDENQVAAKKAEEEEEEDLEVKDSPLAPLVPSYGEPVLVPQVSAPVSGTNISAPLPPDPAAQQPDAPEKDKTAGENETGPLFAAHIADLSELVRSGKERLVIFSGLDDEADCAKAGKLLLDDIMSAGMRVAVVDAASAIISQKPGISDLAADKVEFGEVVFSSDEGDLFEVYWGGEPEIARGSSKPLTLIKALGDICEVVVVFAGRAGDKSSLALFSGARAALVMVAGASVDAGQKAAALGEAKELGFSHTVLIADPAPKTNVA